ncbi:nuclear transport factor 2 family protein [Haliea atlantica]
MTELERLSIIDAIRQLKARYFRTLDSKDWAAYEQVFTPDLVADMRDANGQRDESQLTRGAATYVANLAPLLQDVITVHHGHSPEIEVISDSEATGIWAMEDKLWPGEASPLPFAHLHGYGHYHERYVLWEGAWRISEIRLTRLQVEIN